MNLGPGALSLMRRRALAAATLCCLSALGCKSKPTGIRPPGMVDDEGRAVVSQPAPPPAPVEPAPTPEAPTVYDFERGGLDPGALSAKPTPTGLTSKTALGVGEDAARPRDLNGELSTALSPLSNCVDVAQAATLPDGRLTISVNAYVQGSGRVSRATVTAPGQPTSALGCMQKQVLALSLRAPIDGAPVQVSGTTELQIKKAGGPAAPSANNPIKPAPTNPDIAKPDPGDVAGPP